MPLDWPIHQRPSTARHSRGCPIISWAGRKAKRKVQQLGGREDAVVTAQWEQGAMATVWLGTAPKIAWGFPFLVCREQGSSMGVGTRLPLFATQGGEGEEAAGKVLNPARSPGLWQGQATKKPPTLFPRGGETEFLPLEEQTPSLAFCYCPTLPPPWATDGPRAQGPHSETSICCFISL